MEHVNQQNNTINSTTNATTSAATVISQHQTFRQQKQQQQQQQQQQNEHQQQFCLRWHNHQTSLLSTLPLLLDQSQLTDVSISAEGRILRAHRVVLSACSTFFLELFRALETTNHPVIIIPGASFCAIVALLNFMYSGEVNVYEEQIPTLLNLAETLGIKGLADVQNNKSKRGGREAATAAVEPLPPHTPTPTRTPTPTPTPTPSTPPVIAPSAALQPPIPTLRTPPSPSAALLLPPPLTPTPAATTVYQPPSLPLLGGLVGTGAPPLANHPLANHLLGGSKLPLPLESLLFKSLQFYPNLLPQPLNFSQNALNKTSELLAKYQQQQHQQQHCGYYEGGGGKDLKFNYHGDEYTLPEAEGSYCSDAAVGSSSAAKRLCGSDRHQQQQHYQQQKDIKRIDRIVDSLRCSGTGKAPTHEQHHQSPYSLRLHNACSYGMAAAVSANSPQHSNSNSSSNNTGSGKANTTPTAAIMHPPTSSASSAAATSASAAVAAAAAAQQQLAAACAFAAAAAASMSPPATSAANPTTAATAQQHEPPPSYADSCAAAAAVGAATPTDYSHAAEGIGSGCGAGGAAAYKAHLSAPSSLTTTPLMSVAAPNVTTTHASAAAIATTSTTTSHTTQQQQALTTSAPIKGVSNSKLYATCFICHKQLSNQYNLRVHLETHQNVRYACTVCPHVSRSKDALRKHVSYRHPGAPSPCETEARRKRAATASTNSKAAAAVATAASANGGSAALEAAAGMPHSPLAATAAPPTPTQLSNAFMFLPQQFQLANAAAAAAAAVAARQQQQQESLQNMASMISGCNMAVTAAATTPTSVITTPIKASTSPLLLNSEGAMTAATTNTMCSDLLSSIKVESSNSTPPPAPSTKCLDSNAIGGEGADEHVANQH